MISMCRRLAELASRNPRPIQLFLFSFFYVGNDVGILAIHVDDSTMTGSSVTLQQRI